MFANRTKDRQNNQKIAELHSKVQQLQRQILTLKQNNEQLTKKQEQTNQQLISAQQETNSILDWLNQSQREADNLKTTLAQQQNRQAGLKNQYQNIILRQTSEKQEVYSILSKQLKAKEQLQRQVTHLQAQKTEAEGNLEKAKQQILEMKNKVQQLVFERNQTIMQSKEQRKQLQNLFEQKERQLIQLKRRLDRLQKNLASKDSEVNELKIINQRLKASKSQDQTVQDNSDSQETIRQLYETISDLTDERDQFLLFKRKVYAENDKLRQDMNILKKEKDSSERMISQLKQRIAKLQKDQCDIKVFEAQSTSRSRGSRQSQMKDEKKMIKNLQQKIIRLEMNIKILKSENQMMKSKNQLLEYELNQGLENKFTLQIQKKQPSIFLVETEEMGKSLL